MASTQTAPLKFQGAEHLTTRLVLATLTGKPIRISKIRESSHTNPGLTPSEVSFFRLAAPTGMVPRVVWSSTKFPARMVEASAGF